MPGLLIKKAVSPRREPEKTETRNDALMDPRRSPARPEAEHYCRSEKSLPTVWTTQPQEAHAGALLAAYAMLQNVMPDDDRARAAAQIRAAVKGTSANKAAGPRGTTLRDLREHLGAVHELMKKAVAGGAPPEQFQKLVEDAMAKLDTACEVAGGVTSNKSIRGAEVSYESAVKQIAAALSASGIGPPGVVRGMAAAIVNGKR